MKKWKLFSLLFVALNLFCSASPIRVELNTQSEIYPVYLCEIQAEDSHLSATYLKRLRDVLRFDLQNSGYTSVLSQDIPMEKETAFIPQKWAKIGAMYVVKGIVRENQLQMLLFSVRDGHTKKMGLIPLNGSLTQDRRQMHHLSDAMMKHLFNAPPVASTRILFSKAEQNLHPETHNWESEIWECDWDGENQRKVTDEKGYSITPVFVPPHPEHRNDRFLYVSYKMGQPKIYFSSLDHKTGKPLLSLRGNQLLPSLSPQRDKLAFISDASGRADLFIQSIDASGSLKGKPLQLFSYPGATNASPSFDPSGKTIAFVSDKDGTPRIYMIAAEPTKGKRPKAELITRQNRENTCPSWSPDGSKIAYSAKTGGVRQIWLYDCLAREEKQITFGPGNKENPVWGPGGLHILFNTTDPNSSELYLLNLNQKESVQITEGPGKKHYPTWGIR